MTSSSAAAEVADVERVLWGVASRVGWVLHRIPGETAYKVSLASDEDEDEYLVFGVIFQVSAAPRVLRAVFLFDMTVPPDRRDAVCEYFCRVNWRLAMGGYLFEPDIG